MLRQIGGSILLAMFCYRQRARKLYPQISRPEVVAPATIHPAFDKAAILFGLKIRKAPVDENSCAIPKAMEQLINKNTQRYGPIMAVPIIRYYHQHTRYSTI